MNPNHAWIKRSGGRFVLSLAALSMLYAGHSFAQDDEEVLVEEEILVTARKRAEPLQEVPFSLAVQTQEQLRKTGVTNIEEVSRNIAGFSVQNLGPGQSQVAMRGVSAGQIVRDQPGVKEQVGIYLDESVISLSLFTPDLELIDLNRVEVLRGPQGTLFGSGSLSGTVRYITNQPVLGVTEGETSVEFNSVDNDDTGGNVSAVVNVPLGDRAALRFAGYSTRIGGFMDAIQPDLSVRSNVNEGTRTGARLALRFEPNDSLVITPRIVYQDVDVDGFNRIDVYNILGNPFVTTLPRVELGGRRQFTQLTERFTDEFLLFDVHVDYRLPNGLGLTSITSYTDRDILQIRDATQLTGSITGGTIGLPEEIFTIDAPLLDATTVEVLTQEIRLNSHPDDRVQWVAGVFYSDIERRYGQDLPVIGFEDASGIPTEGELAPKDVLFFSRIPYDFEQFALFGEITYPFTDQLEISAGARYFDFTERRVLNFDGIFADTTIAEPGRSTASGFSPRLMASYALNQNSTLNAQVAKGFRLGGINDPLNEPLCSPEDLVIFGDRPSFDDEELWNYEVGAKTSFMGGRGMFNIAAFHMDISDLQATTTAGTCSSRIIFNVPKAQSRGVEVELFAQPAANLDIGFSASFIDAELRSTITSTDDEGAVSVVEGMERGNRLPTVPRVQLSAIAGYSWYLANGWEVSFNGTVQHVGSRFTQIGDQREGFGTVDLTIFPLGDPDTDVFTFNPELPSYNIANLRLGLRAGSWETTLFVNNITDERAFLALDQERGRLARVGFLTNAPRTIGLIGRYYF